MIGMVKHTAKILTKECNISIRQNRLLGKNIIRKMKVLFNDKRNNPSGICPSSNTDLEYRQ